MIKASGEFPAAKAVGLWLWFELVSAAREVQIGTEWQQGPGRSLVITRWRGVVVEEWGQGAQPGILHSAPAAHGHRPLSTRQKL